jgi:hypothetical protein
LVSPILVRPVREQLEHDRIIRLLHAKSRRRYEAGMNPGVEQNAAVGTGPASVYPDLVLLSQERGRRLQAVVEVETGESVNHLEALAQWAHFAKLRAAFHLYVPSGMVDVARRLCEDNQIHVNEIWSYHTVGDEVRFTLVHRTREAAPLPRAHPAAPRPTAEQARHGSGQAPRQNSGQAPRQGSGQARRRKPTSAAKRSARSAKPPARGKVLKKSPPHSRAQARNQKRR